MKEDERMIIAKVFRYDPAIDPKPRSETYKVPWREKITVLEVLRHIFENFEPIGFRYHCRMMQCGQCAVQVNGEPRLACSTIVEKPGEITIKPLKGFPVVKDLVVDRSKTDQEILNLKPYLQRVTPPTEEPELIKADLRDYFETTLQCRECYVCTAACPIVETAPKRFLAPTLMMKYLAPRVYDPRDNGDRLKEAVSKGLWYCTNCGACKEFCWRHVDVSVLGYRKIRQRAIEKGQQGLVPSEVRDMLDNILKYGNPWKEPRNKRSEWAKDTNISSYEASHDFLYYVGCLGSYDTRANRAANALGEIMLEGDLSFGILGNDEDCDGNDVKSLGEEGLFHLLAEKNIRLFKKLNVKNIVTLSPHAYNTMKNEYPFYGAGFKVVHYTQYLHDMIKMGKLNISKKLDARITYHDPCFLGRHNKEYDAPREILRAIPGVELLEMDRNRDNSFCCGGGAGHFYTDLLHGAEDNPSKSRVKEAAKTGAEILAVSCPVCLTMLDNEIKVEDLEEKLVVKDIAEIVNDSL